MYLYVKLNWDAIFFFPVESVWIPFLMSKEICRLGEGHKWCPLECRLSVGKHYPRRPRKCCRLKPLAWSEMLKLCRQRITDDILISENGDYKIVFILSNSDVIPRYVYFAFHKHKCRSFVLCFTLQMRDYLYMTKMNGQLTQHASSYVKQWTVPLIVLINHITRWLRGPDRPQIQLWRTSADCLLYIPYIYVHIYYVTRLPKKTIVSDTPSNRPVGPVFQAISPFVTLLCLRPVQT